MAANTMKSPVKGVKMNVRKKKVEAPDVPEDEILKESTEKSENTLTKAEKEYINKLIANGYHIRDIEKKLRAIMHLSDEKIELVMKGAKRSSDIIMNLENIQ